MNLFKTGSVLMIWAEEERRVPVSESDVRSRERLADLTPFERVGLIVRSHEPSHGIKFVIPEMPFGLFLGRVSVLVFTTWRGSPHPSVVHRGPVPRAITLSLSRLCVIHLAAIPSSASCCVSSSGCSLSQFMPSTNSARYS